MVIEISSVAINKSTVFYSNIRQIGNFSTSVLKLETEILSYSVDLNLSLSLPSFPLISNLNLRLRLRFVLSSNHRLNDWSLKKGNYDFACCDEQIDWFLFKCQRNFEFFNERDKFEIEILNYLSFRLKFEFKFLKFSFNSKLRFKIEIDICAILESQT